MDTMDRMDEMDLSTRRRGGCGKVLAGIVPAGRGGCGRRGGVGSADEEFGVAGAQAAVEAQEEVFFDVAA